MPYSATQAPHGLPLKHACSHTIRHTGLHAVACGHICCYTHCLCHIGMHARHSLSYKQACNCMQSPILPHMLYLPHKHEYICIICHTRKHVAA